MALVSCRPATAVHWQPAEACSFADELTVFRLAVATVRPLIEPLETLLTPAERERAGRYHQVIDRLRFVGGRGLLRSIIGQYTGQPPNRIAIGVESRNKPVLLNVRGLTVNLAHAGDWIVLAVGRDSVGIDLESVNYQSDYQLVAGGSFSPAEQRAMAGNSDSRRLFYELWTRKEALVKAMGLGITDAFDQVPALPGEYAVNPPVLSDAGDWVVRGFCIDDRHPAALAHRPTHADPFFYTFSSFSMINGCV